MPDEDLELLEQLYNDLVTKGHRDDPLVVKLGELVAKNKPDEDDED